MVTAFSQSRYIEEASAAGAMAYLVKPFSKRDILPAMQVAVARFAETRALEDEVADLERASRDPQDGRPRQRACSWPRA